MLRAGSTPTISRFEHRGLDYRCGGGRNLGEACALIGADPDEIVAELAAALIGGSDAAVWSTMPADALVDHLEGTHQRYLGDEMCRVTALVDKIVSAHGSRHPELVDVAFTTRSTLRTSRTRWKRQRWPV